MWYIFMVGAFAGLALMWAGLALHAWESEEWWLMALFWLLTAGFLYAAVGIGAWVYMGGTSCVF